MVSDPIPQHLPTLSATSCEMILAAQPFIEPYPVAYTIKSVGSSVPSVNTTDLALIYSIDTADLSLISPSVTRSDAPTSI